MGCLETAKFSVFVKFLSLTVSGTGSYINGQSTSLERISAFEKMLAEVRSWKPSGYWKTVSYQTAYQNADLINGL